MQNVFSVFLEIRKILFSGDSRTATVKKNAVIMLIIKGLSLLLSLVMLPLTIGYVSSSIYGIFVTLNSVVSWFSFFDVGLSSGLKNKYTESKAKGDMILAQKYVSTAYAFLSMIAIILLLFLGIFSFFADWNSLLNIQAPENISYSVFIIVTYFSLNFVFGAIGIILIADLKPAASSLIGFIQQLISVLVIIILINTTQGSLLYLCCALCVPPLLTTFIATLYLFSTKYKDVHPSFSAIDFSLAKDLFTLGIKFFIIQISCIVLFQTSNYIMIRNFGADVVTQYNVVYKYFFMLNIVFNILITPVWPAVTDAITKKDINWIRSIIKKYTYITLSFFVIGLFLLLFSKLFIRLWMGNRVEEIPFLLSFSVFLYVCETMMANLYAQILAGAEIFKLEVIICLVSPLLFLLLCYIFINILQMGVYCIPIAIVLANFYGLFISPLQCYLVFFKNKKGIWAAK